jgi:hypothetical protein
VSAARMLAEASIRGIESLPGAGRKIQTHRPTRDITLEADALGRTQRRTYHPCRRVPLPPRGPPVASLPRRGEIMQQPRRGRCDSPQRGYGGSLPR